MSLKRDEKMLIARPLVIAIDKFGASIEGYGDLVTFVANIYRETSDLSLKIYGETINDVKRLVTNHALNLKDGVYIDNQVTGEPDYEVIDVQPYRRHYTVLIKKKVV